MVRKVIEKILSFSKNNINFINMSILCWFFSPFGRMSLCALHFCNFYVFSLIDLIY